MSWWNLQGRCDCPSFTCLSFPLLSWVPLFVAPWAIACQAPLSMEFSRQEYWSRLPFPTPGNRPDPGIKPPSLASSALLLYHCDTWKAQFYIRGNHKAIRDEWLHLQICNMNITLRCSGLSFDILFQPIHEIKFFHLGKRFAERKVNELNHLNGQIGKILLFLLHVTFLPEIK